MGEKDKREEKGQVEGERMRANDARGRREEGRMDGDNGQELAPWVEKEGKRRNE